MSNFYYLTKNYEEKKYIYVKLLVHVSKKEMLGTYQYDIIEVLRLNVQSNFYLPWR